MFKIYKVEILFIKQFIKYFAISLLIFSSIFFIYSFLQIMNEPDIVKGISQYYLIKTLLYLLPSTISISLGFSIIFAVFISTGELSITGEMIAIRSGGYSYPDISKNLLIIIVFLTFISYLLVNYIVPVYELKSREYLRTMLNRVTNIELKPQSFDRISSFNIYFQKLNGNEMEDVMMFEDVKESGYNSNSFIKIIAKRGVYKIIKEKGISIMLLDGEISHIERGKYHLYNLGNFKEYRTFIPFEINQKDYDIPPKHMKTKDLIKALKTSTDKEKIYKIKKELYARKANVFSVFIFAILSLIVAFYFERESKFLSFISSIVMIIFYYTLNVIANIITSKKPDLIEYAFFVAPLIMSGLSIYLYIFKLSKK